MLVIPLAECYKSILADQEHSMSTVIWTMMEAVGQSFRFVILILLESITINHIRDIIASFS